MMRYLNVHDEWLKKHINEYSTYVELADNFNKKFGSSVHHTCLKTHCLYSLNLHKERNKPEYPKKREEWIKLNYKKYNSFKKLTDDFNEIFKTNKTSEQISDYCHKKLHVKLTQNIGKFRVGDKNLRELPIGTERLYNDYIWIKVNNVYTKDTYENFKINWMPKQRYLYEQFNNVKLKKSDHIIFLNGDKSDFRKENLRKVNRHEMGVMSLRGWWNENPIFTEVAIKECELEKLV